MPRNASHSLVYKSNPTCCPHRIIVGFPTTLEKAVIHMELSILSKTAIYWKAEITMEKAFETSLTMQVVVTLICFAIATQSWKDGECLIYMPNPPNIYIWKKISTVSKVPTIFLHFHWLDGWTLHRMTIWQTGSPDHSPSIIWALLNLILEIFLPRDNYVLCKEISTTSNNVRHVL